MVRISFCGINNLYTKKPVVYTKPSSLAPLKCDTVSFTGKGKEFKKSGLDAFSLIAVERFKAPIEKFKNQSELDTWAKGEIQKILDDDKLKDKPDILYHRDESKKRILGEWEEVLFSKDSKYSKSPCLGLIVFQSITKNLTNKNIKEPVEYDKETFEQTIKNIEEKIEKNRNHAKSGFDFAKQYKENLKTKYFNEEKEKLGLDKDYKEKFWVEIPSQKDDPEHFEENIKKLKALSSDLWCTTEDYKARGALENDSFYICQKSNEAKLGVRMEKGKVFDVQGKKNDFHIPYKYAPIVEKFIADHNFELSNDPNSKFEENYKEALKANEIWNAIPEAIKKGDYKAIMKYMELEPKKLDSGLYEVAKFVANPEFLNYFKKYGVSAEGLLSRIEVINGDASFRGYKFDTTFDIKEIKGNADFTDNNLKNLDKIEKIGGNLNLYNAQITDLGKLKYVGGSMNCFGNCPLNNLGKITYIGGNADINAKQLAHIDQLKHAKNMELLQKRKSWA